eukprot:5192727-Amphidinium_carterae.2
MPIKNLCLHQLIGSVDAIVSPCSLFSRQVAVVKGHNRDTAYFSILDSEWPQLKVAFETYLADSGIPLKPKHYIPQPMFNTIA